MEKKIIESFKKYMKGEIDNLELFVSSCDDDKDYVQILEKQDNGRVWECKIKNNEVIEVYEIN